MLTAALLVWVVSAAHPSLPGPTVPDGLGVNIHFAGAPGREVDQIADTGFRFVRRDLKWAEVERRKGEYDFAAHDQLVAALRRRGLRPLFILNYGNDLYEAGAPRSPAARAAFVRFTEAVVRRYRGLGALWEMWNEPNTGFWAPRPDVGEYATLTRAVGEAIRRVAPGEAFIGPGTSKIDLNFLRGCFRAGLLEVWDAVTVHPYRPGAPEGVWDEYARLQGLIAQYAPAGKSIPIVASEWGYSDAQAELGEEGQARYVIRTYLANLVAGVPLTICYDWRDGDRSNPEQRYGVADKAAGRTLQRFARELRGFRYHLRIAREDPNEVVLAFRKGDELKLVAYTLGPPKSARLPLGTSDSVRLDGEPAILTPRSRTPEVESLLTATPLPFAEMAADEATLRKVRRGVGVRQEVRRVHVGAWDLNLAPAERGLHLDLGKAPAAATVEAIVTSGGQSSKQNVTLNGNGEATLSDISDAWLQRGVRVQLRQGDRVMAAGTARFRRLALPIGLGPNYHFFDDGNRAVPIRLEGTAVRAAEAPAAVRQEFRIRYRFGKGNRYFTLSTSGANRDATYAGARSLGYWLYSGGGGDLHRVRVIDSTGQTFQIHVGTLDSKGWRYVEIPLMAEGAMHWGGANDGMMHGPIRIDALILVDNANGDADRELRIANPVVNLD